MSEVVKAYAAPWLKDAADYERISVDSHNSNDGLECGLCPKDQRAKICAKRRPITTEAAGRDREGILSPPKSHGLMVCPLARTAFCSAAEQPRHRGNILMRGKLRKGRKGAGVNLTSAVTSCRRAFVASLCGQ